MLFQVLKLDDLIALGVDAFNIEIVVESEKSSTGNGSDFRITAFERAFSGRTFAHPVSDACFTEHFTTRMALPGFSDNLTANKTVVVVIIKIEEALSIISVVGHFVGIVFGLYKFYKIAFNLMNTYFFCGIQLFVWKLMVDIVILINSS